MGKGFLNRTCRLATSSVFQSDVIGTNTVESYFPQFAMYEIYNGPFKIKGKNILFHLTILIVDPTLLMYIDFKTLKGITQAPVFLIKYIQ